MALSLVSVNIEQEKHLERVFPFLSIQKPDILCVQELLERDIPRFEEQYGPCIAFAPTCFVPRPEGSQTEGIGLFSSLSNQSVIEKYYVGSRDTVRLDDGKSDVDTHVLLGADIEGYRILTTHFTWTQKGESTEKQKVHAESLFAELDALGEFVLCGDFNAPRTGETAALFIRRYTDNIPSHYETSIDISLHRAGKTNASGLQDKMVDYLFTTPQYLAKNVSLEFGVSDHAAIIATIEKSQQNKGI